MNKVRRIDLTVPTGWNQCSTEQLEQITQNLLYLQATQDRYHPYDPLKFKARCFFSLSGIEVVSAIDQTRSDAFPRSALPLGSSKNASEPNSGISNAHINDGRIANSPEPKRYLCRFVGDKKAEPFPMADWQLMSFVNDNLQWLDDFNQLQIFPYEQYKKWPWSMVNVQCSMLSGPQPLLDDYTWQRYRQTQDYLQLYVMLTNEQGDAEEIEDARTHFLMAIFDAKKPYRCLRRMPAYRFQLILIWWQSQMAWLQKKFKRCFKKSAEGGIGSLPIELYTRSTATLQKYLSLSEDQINQQPCLVVLQHLEDMAREAEEMERIRRKK